MAKPGVILSANRSAASSVAVGILCLLGLVQLGTLAQMGWKSWQASRAGHSAPAAAATAPQLTVAPPAAPVNPASRAANPVVAKSAPVAPVKPGPFDVGGLPPLPQLPGQTAPKAAVASVNKAVPEDSLPPLPKIPGASATKLNSTPRVPATEPAPTVSHQPRVLPSLPPQAPTSPATPKPSTGNAQVDELLEVAILSRDASDNEGALKALERADLVLPDNPLVLRQRALTFSKMGQMDKANALMDRAAKLGPSTSSTMPGAGALETPSSLSGAFGGGVANGPLSLGQCTVARDPTDTTGEKVILKLPVRATPGAAISPNDWNVDVFFFDKVDGITVEPTKSDPPQYAFDLPVDFQAGEEVVTVIYHMPRLSQKEVAEFGNRTFHGYVAKLYYKGRLMGSAAAPRDLMAQNDAGAPPANPLLPAVR